MIDNEQNKIIFDATTIPAEANSQGFESLDILGFEKLTMEIWRHYLWSVWSIFHIK